ncbi:MFS transporter [Maridesulfovibrio hydrothermalis]|uniref:Major facilitator superfamily MFS_1 n=1 Tax=Maridesulfovibrio hydrothermalis AM13 = DSM 14728 TaxID=1121451 RepID=L0R8N5_9BACT|nr:MFS transporter [Maridesulfovibrio hydrothermalis]CCO23119.1 Major facilitator superfamily MFS_1 [Maridesulfovibrio hydrothermalis AM13 = DSM 14728]
MSEAKKRAVIFTVSVTQFTMPFMFSAVGIALPVIGREFGASGLDLSLVESIYIGSVAALLIPFGRLADMHGRQPMFRLGVLLYAVFTFFLGFAHNIETVIILRMAQGIAGGMAIATNMALLTDAVPKNERGRAMGLAVAAVFVGLSAGPYIGGLVTTHFGWRWLFFLGMIPLGLSYIVAHLNLESKFRPSSEKFDWIGSIVVALSVTALVFGGTGIGAGWSGPVLLFAGLAGFVLFIKIQNSLEYPLVELSLFKERGDFFDASIVQFINYAGTFGIVFLFSLYLQSVKGLSPHQAGLVLVIQPIVQAVLSPLCGRLADSFSPRKIALVGMLGCTVGTIMGAMVTFDTTLPYLYVMFTVLGVGLALFSAPNMIILMSSVPPSRFGFASAITGALRTIGMVASMVVIAIFLSTIMGDVPVTPESADTYLLAMRFSLITLSGLCVLAVLVSIRAVIRKSAVAKKGLCVQSAGDSKEG